MTIDKAIATVVKTGKVALGVKRTLEAARTGKAKLIIIASNCPENLRADILYYAQLSKVSVYLYPSSSRDLGIACRKPFTVAALAVKEPGDSAILKLVETSDVKQNPNN